MIPPLSKSKTGSFSPTDQLQTLPFLLTEILFTLSKLPSLKKKMTSTKSSGSTTSSPRKENNSWKTSSPKLSAASRSKEIFFQLETTNNSTFGGWLTDLLWVVTSILWVPQDFLLMEATWSAFKILLLQHLRSWNYAEILSTYTIQIPIAASPAKPHAPHASRRSTNVLHVWIVTFSKVTSLVVSVA